MKKFGVKKLLLGLAVCSIAMGFTGCRKAYDTPEFVTIQPSQTAFLIPLTGDTTKQGAFESEEMLLKAKVATKEVRIPHRWEQTGRNKLFVIPQGEYRDNATLIIVERKPVSREWTDSNSTGTSTSNQGIVAESKESITFTAKMNCISQIDEIDAVKFLYRYNNKSLGSIMDEEIRSQVDTYFVEECSKYTMDEILQNKSGIMNTVRDKIIPYFKDRGVTITALGLKGDFAYQDRAIQTAINAKFKADREYEAQKTVNKNNIEKAEADAQAKLKSQETINKIEIEKAKAEAEAMKIRQSTLELQIELKKLDNQKEWINKWNGTLPETVLGDDMQMLYQMPKEQK